MNKSWRTRASGILSGLYIILGEVGDLLGVRSSFGTDGVFSVDTVVVGLALLGLGTFSRDNKVTSEEAGAK